MKYKNYFLLIFLTISISLLGTVGFLIKLQDHSPINGQVSASYELNPNAFQVSWTPPAADIVVNDNLTDYQEDCSICCFPNGSFIIVWESDNQPANGEEIYAKIFNANGNNKTPEFKINSNTTDDQANPVVCCWDDGSFVVAWMDSRDSATLSDDVYARIFNNNTQPITDDFRLNNYTSNQQGSPSLCCRSNGTFVATWTSQVQDGDGYGIYASIFDKTGNNITRELKVNDQTLADQLDPDICCFSNGSFVIVWEDKEPSPDKIYGQIFDSNGDNITSSFLVSKDLLNHYDPAVCCVSDSEFVACWRGNDASGFGIELMKFNTSGVNTTNEIIVNDNETNNQEYPDICCFSDNKFIVTWTSIAQDGDSYGVYTKIFDHNLKDETGDLQVNYNATNQQLISKICCYSNKFVIAWQGNRLGSNHEIWCRIGLYIQSSDLLMEFLSLLALTSPESGNLIFLIAIMGVVTVVIIIVLINKYKS